MSSSPNESKPKNRIESYDIGTKAAGDAAL